MKSRLLSAFLLVTAWLMGTNVSAQALDRDESGAYLIGSKAELLAWSRLSGYEGTNVVLTADIENIDFKMCATTGYSGTFNGNGHTITVNFNFPGEMTGLFVKANKATIRNLIVKGEVVSTYKNTAALVSDGSATFENTIVDISMHNDVGANASNAAFIGYGRGTTFNNCVAILKVDGRDPFNCGFVGWVGNGQQATANNCISIVDTELPTAFSFGNPAGQFGCNNCFAYQQDKDDPMTTGVTYLAGNALASGEVCYALNNGAGSTVFYQTLGEDAYPVPFSTHKEVFGNGVKRCDGMALEGEITYSNTNESVTPPHTDVDGYCSVCGKVLLDHITPDAEGFYPLATVADIKWFTNLVNVEHMTTVKAKLTADIDFEGVVNAHTPIGPNSTYKYNGVFDGQGHSIKNMILDLNQDGVGFFGWVRGGTIIRNLVIDESCSVKGNKLVGGLIGAIQTAADIPLTVENCVNQAKVTGSGPAGGIIGAGQSGYPSIKLTNCLNTGEITGTPATAFCSWINKGGSSVTNCVNTGIINGMDNAGGKFVFLCNLIRYEPGTLTMENCYDFSGMQEMEGMEGIGQGMEGEWMTDSPAESGELCYMLNGDQTNIVWHQVLGKDASPMPFFKEGGVVYANGDVDCAGTPMGDVEYSNTSDGSLPLHEFEDGICINCGTPQLDFAEVVDGFHCIDTPSKLYWLSMMVNDFKHGDWNVRLTADLDMEDYSDLFQSIGTSSSKYTGHFDGQGHRISNLHVEGASSYSGFIGMAGGGAIIENMLMDETCSINATGECVAFVGGANAAGSITIRNIGNMANVYATGKQAAGIFGGNSGSHATLVIENCFSMGSIEGSSECAALVAWGGSNSPVVSNCWSCSEVSGIDRADMYLVRHGNGVFKNIYSTQGEQGAIIEYDLIESGELCYKLNGDQNNIVWYQNIDNDAETDYQPVPFSNGHARVYAQGKKLCDGSVDPTSMKFSNTEGSDVTPDHEFDHGFCTVCGEEQLDYAGFIKAIKNPDFTVDNFGWEGTALNVKNGVAEHQNKTFDTYQKVADLKAGVYCLSLQGYTRVANIDNEDVYGSGELDEDNDILRNSYIYAESDGKRVAHRLVDITTGAMAYRLNDGVGETMLSNELFVPATSAVTAKYFAKGKYTNRLYFAVTADTITIGLSNQIQSANCQTIVDRIRLEYVGDDAAAYALIAQQIADDAQMLEELEGQEPLKEEYSQVTDGAASLTGADVILSAADKAARYPDIIKLSVSAYAAYIEAVEEINAYWQENKGKLTGSAADALKAYLTENNAASEQFPNGTYVYIKDNRLIGIDELKAETAFAKQLLAAAVKGSTAEGMDITSLLVNAKFNEGNWNGWTVVLADSKNGNIVDNSGFKDVFPVAAGYNSTFEVSQQITGLPNGIYELEANAYHRPGQAREGNYDGMDYIPAKLFLNDYATPILSVYSDILPLDEAINGVNCRIDSTDDFEAPHNGEETGSKDISLDGLGVIPDNTYTASFAFNGGRYLQKAYAIVTDGNLTVGVRNGDTPWKNKNHTVWGGFRLTYQGTSAQVFGDILEQYTERMEKLQDLRETFDFHFSSAHLDNISSLISQAKSTSNVETKMECIKKISDEFNTIESSHNIYEKLVEISDYALNVSEGMQEGEAKTFMDNLFNELTDAVAYGSLTDAEAEAKVADLMENPYFGGVIYVQGDLADPENYETGEWDYNKICTLYPLYKNEQGKWVGSVTLQDRSRRANANQRAGFYFRRYQTIYKCNASGRNFVTPAQQHFGVQEGGVDYQALNGTYDITLDLENMTVDFEQTDKYNWDNQVYVTGTLKNREGIISRWQNTEHWPLQHMGDGKYAGVVDMELDNANNFCSFGIIACRSTQDMVNYSTTGRSSWTEARYGSEEQYKQLKSGEKVTNLVRGMDRTWRISPAGKYLVEFDMNNATMRATLLQTEGAGTEADPYLIANAADMISMQDRMTSGETTYMKLVDDIDLRGRGWYPLNSSFFGNDYECGHEKAVELDGNNHIIRNVTVAANTDNDTEVGFFASLCGHVSNLGMYNVTVADEEASASGLLAGMLGSDTFDGVTIVENSYFNGAVSGNMAVGGVAGTSFGTAIIENCYANANVSGEGVKGDLVGQAESGLTIQNSYGGGVANGSEAEAAVAAGSAVENNVLFFDGNNQSTLCTTVSAWAAWANDGQAGNGFPILKWQVERGDHVSYCGYVNEEADAIRNINAEGSTEGIYNLSGQRVRKAEKGVFIQNGRKVAVK